MGKERDIVGGNRCGTNITSGSPTRINSLGLNLFFLFLCACVMAYLRWWRGAGGGRNTLRVPSHEEFSSFASEFRSGNAPFGAKIKPLPLCYHVAEGETAAQAVAQALGRLLKPMRGRATLLHRCRLRLFATLRKTHL